MTEEAKKEAERELGRLGRMSPAAAEYTVTRTYLDWLVTLPWNVLTTERIDINKAREVLDRDHYDLEKIKERILEYLAVLELKPQGKLALPHDPHSNRAAAWPGSNSSSPSSDVPPVHGDDYVYAVHRGTFSL